MTIQTRRLLFYSLFLVFVFVGAGTVLYSHGWRLDAGSLNIRKTGAIYIKTEPRQVSIKIDNINFKDRSGLIQKGTLVSNLPPQSYKIEIKKAGYFPYYKNLRVEPAMVSELTDVTLVPKEIKKEPLDASVKIKGDDFVDISKDGNKIILKDADRIYYLYDLNKLSTAFNVNAAFDNASTPKKSDIINIAFHPFESESLLVETKNGISVLDVRRLRLEKIIKKQPLAWTAGNGNIYYTPLTNNQQTATKNFTFYSYNLILKTETALNKKPLAVEGGAEIKEISIDNTGNRIAFLDNFDDIYVFNLNNQELTQIAHSAKDFVFSPDNKKIAFLDKDGVIGVYFLEDWNMGIRKKAGEVIRLNIKNREDIKKIVWHKDSTHLFIDYIKENPRESAFIDFVEVDDRLPINQYIIINEPLSFIYDQEKNIIYFIQNNSLWKTEL